MLLTLGKIHRIRRVQRLKFEVPVVPLYMLSEHNGQNLSLCRWYRR